MNIDEFLSLSNQEQQIIMNGNNPNFNRGLDNASKLAADAQNLSGTTVATTVKFKDVSESTPLEFVLKNDTSTDKKGFIYDALDIASQKADAIVAIDGVCGVQTYMYYQKRSTGIPLISDSVEIEVTEGTANAPTTYQKIKFYEVNYPTVPSTKDKLYSEVEIRMAMNTPDVTTSGVIPVKYATGTSLIEFITARAYYVVIPANTTLTVRIAPKLEGNAFSAAR